MRLNRHRNIRTREPNPDAESDFRLIAFFGDLKNDIRARPLVLVFREIEPVVQDVPNHFLAGNEFCYFNFARMDVFVAVSKLIPEFFSFAFNIS